MVLYTSDGLSRILEYSPAILRESLRAVHSSTRRPARYAIHPWRLIADWLKSDSKLLSPEGTEVDRRRSGSTGMLDTTYRLNQQLCQVVSAGFDLGADKVLKPGEETGVRRFRIPFAPLKSSPDTALDLADTIYAGNRAGCRGGVRGRSRTPETGGTDRECLPNSGPRCP
jgi:hypothetical protein